MPIRLECLAYRAFIHVKIVGISHYVKKANIVFLQKYSYSVINKFILAFFRHLCKVCPGNVLDARGIVANSIRQS